MQMHPEDGHFPPLLFGLGGYEEDVNVYKGEDWSIRIHSNNSCESFFFSQEGDVGS